MRQYTNVFMINPIEKRDLGLQRLARAAEMPDLLGPALISLHGALEDYARSWLARHNHIPHEIRACIHDRQCVAWHEVLDLMQRYGGLSTRARYRIQYITALQQEVARGGAYRGTHRDVEQYAALVQEIIGEGEWRGRTGRRSFAALGLRRASKRAGLLLGKLWFGQKQVQVRWWRLASMAFVTLFALLGFWIGAITITWLMPQKVVGIVCLAVAALAACVIARAALQCALHLGGKRLVVTLAAAYLCIVGFVGLQEPHSAANAPYWLRTAAEVARSIADGTQNIGYELMLVPSRLAQRASGPPVAFSLPHIPLPFPDLGWQSGVPRAPSSVPPSTTAEEGLSQAPPALATNTPLRTLQIGDVVRVTGTDDAPLRARHSPGTTAEVVARFAPTSQLRIIGGPHQSDAYTWWQVRGEQGEGWCVENFLTPSTDTAAH
jgi:hypothetical protein